MILNELAKLDASHQDNDHDKYQLQDKGKKTKSVTTLILWEAHVI